MQYDIGVIPGDGVGPEVISASVPLLEEVASDDGVSITWTEYEWNSTRYLHSGEMMPDDALEQLENHDAILLGAVGHPEIPDHRTLTELLLPIRKGFNQQVCRRPSVLFPGVESPLKGYTGGDIDFVVFRENTEGEYANSGGREHVGFSHEVAVQSAVFTRQGTEAIIRAAFEAANKRDKEVTNVTKSNAQAYSMVFWDDIFDEIAADYPSIATERLLVDAASMDLVRRPDEFDVIVASNLFGDILTDIGSIITGSLGLAPSANINIDQIYPSMFEPVHGAAFDIMGENIANPIATVLSGAMLFDHLGEHSVANTLWDGVADMLADPAAPRTPDLNGNSSTTDVISKLSTRILS